MAEKIRVLLIDDSQDEQWLLEDHLTQAGYQAEILRVDEETPMRQALAESQWDVLLVDYRMPAFSAQRALDVYQQLQLDIPFIIVSGAIGEEAAVAMMRAGAHDYVLKSNRSRLVAVIERELRETRLRRTQAETSRALRQSHQLFGAIAESAQDAIVMVNQQGGVAYWNPAAERIFGYRSEEVLGRNVELLLVPASLQPLYQRYMRRIQTHGYDSVGQTLEVVALNKMGQEIPVELSISAAQMEDQHWLIGMLRDISERKSLEQQLRHLANYDALTGLYNRRMMEQRLDEEIRRAERYATKLSLFFLDIDHFKQVNDQHGHTVGDELLRQLSRGMQDTLRTVDLIARYGGEEFVVILPETGLEHASELAQRLCDTIAATPMRLEAAEEALSLTITVSIGVAGYPQCASSARPLVDAADSAMYSAKRQGRNRVCIAEPKPLNRGE